MNFLGWVGWRSRVLAGRRGEVADLVFGVVERVVEVCWRGRKTSREGVRRGSCWLRGEWSKGCGSTGRGGPPGLMGGW